MGRKLKDKRRTRLTTPRCQVARAPEFSELQLQHCDRSGWGAAWWLSGGFCSVFFFEVLCGSDVVWQPFFGCFGLFCFFEPRLVCFWRVGAEMQSPNYQCGLVFHLLFFFVLLYLWVCLKQLFRLSGPQLLLSIFLFSGLFRWCLLSRFLWPYWYGWGSKPLGARTLNKHPSFFTFWHLNTPNKRGSFPKKLGVNISPKTLKFSNKGNRFPSPKTQKITNASWTSPSSSSAPQEIGERYGHWQDAECRDLKSCLAARASRFERKSFWSCKNHSLGGKIHMFVLESFVWGYLLGFCWSLLRDFVR